MTKAVDEATLLDDQAEMCRLAGTVRLDSWTTKNGDGRVFPVTEELQAVLEGQYAEHLRLKQAGQIVPWVFFRLLAKSRGGATHPKRILSYNKAWKAACVAAGAPGRIPYDLRRTAVRNLVRAGIPERVAMRARERDSGRRCDRPASSFFETAYAFSSHGLDFCAQCAQGLKP
jgi:integrase